MGTRIGIVTGRETGKNRGTGLPVRLLQVQLTDVTDVQTVQLIEQAGEESNPPNGSLVAITAAGQAYKISTGIDDGIEPIMGPGGKRIYSTDSNGVVIAEIKLDPEGRILMANPEVSIDIDPDGTITITNPGATISVSPAGVVDIDAPTVHMTGDLNVDGTITAPDIVGTVSVTAPQVTGSTEVTFGSISGSTHVHQENGDGGGITDGPQ